MKRTIIALALLATTALLMLTGCTDAGTSSASPNDSVCSYEQDFIRIHGSLVDESYFADCGPGPDFNNSGFTAVLNTDGWRSIAGRSLVVPSQWFADDFVLDPETGEVIPDSEFRMGIHRVITYFNGCESVGYLTMSFEGINMEMANNLGMYDDIRDNTIRTSFIEFTPVHGISMYELPDRIVWVETIHQISRYRFITLYHDGNLELFHNNRDLLMTIVSTSLTHNGVTVQEQLDRMSRDEAAAARAAEIAANAGVTLSNFESLRSGMTHSRVAEFLGGYGVLSSNTRIPDPFNPLLSTTWRTYIWDGPASGSGITIIFRNGSLYSMSQIGLR